MRTARLISLIAVLALVAHANAADLRVACATGLAVLVDGEPAGTCDERERDLLVSDLEEGNRDIRLELPGVPARELTLEMGASSRQLVIGAFAADTASDDGSASRPFGTLEISSDVPRCWVELAGRRIQKVEPVLTVLDVPAGSHVLWLQQLGTLLETKIKVPANGNVQIDVNFAEKTTDVRVDAPADPDHDGTAGGDKAAADTSCIHWWLEVLQTSSVPKVGEASEALEEAGYPISHQKVITVETGEIPLYQLRIGPFANELSAKQVYFKIKRLGYPGARVLPKPCPSP
jgi:hypothetical protein